MSKVDFQRKKKDEEEQKIVGQQQKTQSTANKPTGTTSIPKDNQGISSRTQKSAASSSRTEEKRATENERVVKKNTFTANRAENRRTPQATNSNENKRSTYTDFSSRKQNHSGSGGTWGYNKTVDDARSRYAMSLKNGIPGPESLPKAEDLRRAPGSGIKQTSNLDRYINSNPNFDFTGKETIGSRQQAEQNFENKYQGIDKIRENNRQDASTLNSFLAGAGNGVLSTLGDIASLGEKLTPEKSTEGMTPDQIYERAMNTGRSLNNWYGNNIHSDYEAYKNYVLDRMENGEVTDDELRKMQDLEDKYSQNPLHALSNLGKRSEAVNEALSEGHEIANVAGSMAPMLLGNYAVNAALAPELAAAGKIANPLARTLATQGINLAPDIVTDTLPEMLRNINEGKSAGEIAKDAAINVGLNEAANLGFEYAPKGIKAIADKINASNMAKRAASDVAPEVVEQVAKKTVNNVPGAPFKGITDMPYQNVDEVIQPAVSGTPKPADNMIKNNGFRNILRDNEYAKLADMGGSQGQLDEAFSNIIRATDSGDKAAYDAAMSNYRQLAEANGFDANRILNRLDRYVKDDISEDLDEELINSIANNVDTIDAELKKLDAIGVPPTKNGSDWLSEAHKALDDYENAVFDGGDVDGAAKSLNRALGNLDSQAKKLDGYDGAFSQWKGGGTARGDLYSNTGNIPKQLNVEATPEEKAMFDEWNARDAETMHAVPANKAAENTEIPNNVAPEVKASESVPNAESLPEASTDIPSMDDASSKTFDRGPEGRIVDTDDIKERGYARSTRNNPDIPDEVAADFVDNPEIYNVLHNKDTKAKSDAILEQGFDKAFADYKDLLNKKDPAAVPLGYDLAKQMIENGDSRGAADLIRDMSKSLTESGQFSQAAAITLMRNDPMTALRYAEKEIDALNTNGVKKFGKKWNDFKLTDDEIKAFNSIDAGDKEAIANLYDKIGVRLGKEYPTTMLDKILEGRKIAMLFNPRTISRNAIANIPTRYMRKFSDRIEAVGQNIVHLIDPEYKVTQSITGGNKESKNLATQVYNSDKVQSLMKNTAGKYEVPELKSSLLENKQMFKGTFADRFLDKYSGKVFNKVAEILGKDVKVDGGIQALNKKLYGKEGVESALETIRNTTYKLLDIGDSPFVKGNFVDRLSSYIKAQGIKSIDDVPDEAIEIAWEEAMKATYKDNSWAVKMTQGVRNKGIGSIPYIGKPLGEALIPFVQAPANIAARMIDYSPLRGSKGVYDIIKGASGGNKELLTKGIEETAKGLTGTAAAVLGYELYNAGILTGAYSEDTDQKAFQKQHGFREYAIKYGPDKYYTLDWMQPAFQNLMAGVIVADAVKNSDEYDSMLLQAAGYDGTKIGKAIGTGKKIATGSLNSWFDQSTMQNIKELFSGGYGKTDIAGNIADIAINDFAGSFVPASINATSKVMDTTQRNTYDKSNVINNFINQQKAKIPKLSETLPAKYDTWGKEMKYADSSLEAAFNRFLNPGEGTTDTSDEVDKEITRLFDATAENGVFPLVAPYEVGGRKLNNSEVSEYQKDIGTRSRQAVEDFINSDFYGSTPDTEKAEILKNIYDTSKAITERDLFDKEVANNSTYKGAIAAYDDAGGGENGTKAIVDYYTKKSITDQAGFKSNSNVAKAIAEDLDNDNMEAAQAKIDAAQELNSLGLDSSYAVSSYYKAAETIPDLTTEEFANTYKAMDTDGNQSLKQDEVIGYLNDNKITSQAEADKIWEAYGKDWKSIPSLVDGEWTTKKNKSKSTGTTTSNEIKPTGNNNLDAKLKAKAKVREDYQKNKIPIADDLPEANQSTASSDGLNWQLNNGYNLKTTKTYERAQAAGIPDSDFVNAFWAADTSGNGKITKDEAKAYLNALNDLSQEEKRKWFDVLVTRKSKNPY